MQLKKQGTRFEIMTKVSEWINDSEIYQNMDSSHKDLYKKLLMDKAEKILRVKLD